MTILMQKKTLSETSHDSEEWIKTIDRGRLIHVTCNTYNFIYAVEMRTRQHFSMSHASTIVAGSKMVLLQAILSDENVKDCFQTISEEWEDNEAQILLQLTVKQWITIHDFSFTAAWMEAYKQSKKTTIQKLKGLRKKLLPKSAKVECLMEQ